MVSRHIDFRFSRHSSKSFETIPSAQIKTDIPITLFFSGKLQLFVYLFDFFYFHSEISWNSKIHSIAYGNFYFLFVVVWLGLGDLLVSQDSKNLMHQIF